MKMRQLQFLVVLSLMFLSPSSSFAAGGGHDAHHGPADARPQSAEMMRGAGMGMMDMDRMRVHMREMHEMMERIHRSDDPEERARLMQEHMEMMHKGMGHMHGMMGMGRGMSPEQHQQRMEERMDLMQQMMEQMMEHMMARDGMRMPRGQGR